MPGITAAAFVVDLSPQALQLVLLALASEERNEHRAQRLGELRSRYEIIGGEASARTGSFEVEHADDFLFESTDCSGLGYVKHLNWIWNPSFTELQLAVKADAQQSVFVAHPESQNLISVTSVLRGDGSCETDGGSINTEVTPLSAAPITTLDQYVSPFHIEQATPPTMAIVPALNGPLGFVLAGALAGYWLAVRRRS